MPRTVTDLKPTDEMVTVFDVRSVHPEPVLTHHVLQVHRKGQGVLHGFLRIHLTVFIRIVDP